MLRTTVAMVLGLLLSGCWASDRELFGPGDWARPDIAGEYEVESPSDFGGPGRKMMVSARSDGLFVIRHKADEEEDDILLMGLVPIPNGSGRFFLAMDLSTGDEAAFHYIARLTLEDGISLYYPDCAGTAARPGLLIEEAGKAGLLCSFSTRQALLDAALEAEEFLSARHVVTVMPMYSLTKVEAIPGPDDIEDD